MTFYKNPVLLVDGHNLLFKSFFGLPRFTSRYGVEVHGVVGFLGILRKMIEISDTKYCYVVFDGEHSGERKKLNRQYKANRKKYDTISNNPFTQLNPIKKALSHLDIYWEEVKKYEADDIIATVVKKRPSWEVVIASYDSDFFALVDKRVKILRYKGGNSYYVDQEWIIEKFGIQPSQFSLFKAIAGDKADNIVGVPGMGPVAARKITKENLPLSESQKKHVAESMKLIQLKNDVTHKTPTKKLIKLPKNIREIKITKELEFLGIL